MPFQIGVLQERRGSRPVSKVRHDAKVEIMIERTIENRPNSPHEKRIDSILGLVVKIEPPVGLRVPTDSHHEVAVRGPKPEALRPGGNNWRVFRLLRRLYGGLLRLLLCLLLVEFTLVLQVLDLL